MADFLRCPVASGRSTSFCASFTPSMSEPPPCRFSIFAMSAMSAYCTDASDARFTSRIRGVLWYATAHPSSFTSRLRCPPMFQNLQDVRMVQGFACLDFTLKVILPLGVIEVLQRGFSSAASTPAARPPTAPPAPPAGSWRGLLRPCSRPPAPAVRRPAR